MTLERKEKEKEQRRNQIIDAAQALFFTKPYDEITIEAIAEKAQLAKGTVYLYFESKEDLYSAVALRGARMLNQMFKEKIKGKKNGMQKAFATGEAYYEFYKRYPQDFRMLGEAENLLAQCRDYPNIQELGRLANGNFEAVLDAVTEGIKDGSIRPDVNPKLASIFLILSTRAMIQQPAGFEMFLKESGANKDVALKFTLDALRRSLENTKTQEAGER
jgi:AcrR family transcriptional regulator